MRLIKGEELQALVSACTNRYVASDKTEMDVVLGRRYWKERDSWPLFPSVHVLLKSQVLAPYEKTPRIITELGLSLKPGEFVRTETEETFVVPSHILGIFTLRSWAAQSGLGHPASITLKPNWQGCVVMELSNSLRNHTLVLPPRAPIGQVQFFDVS